MAEVVETEGNVVHQLLADGLFGLKREDILGLLILMGQRGEPGLVLANE